ncbi:MAG: hypothetical protein HYT76_06710 [Deltaproteobacteria bacterium]|nr:hypothetical protein [Deltaproteobacteria bacterium]
MRKIYLLFILLLLPVTVFAVAGALDTTFSGDGLMTTRIRSNVNSGNSHVTSVAVQSDGKIVTAGYARENGGDQFALARFTVNGALDSSFGPSGSNGAVITNLEECSDERIQGMVLQTDGKIVVGGYCRHTDTSRDRFVVARYKIGGTLDETFSGDGKEIVDPGELSYWRINALTLQSDDKILVAGFTTPVGAAGGVPSENVIISANRFALARFTTGGVLDTSFGTSGYFFVDFGSSTGVGARAHSIAIRDGKVIVGGDAGTLLNFNPVLARCNDLDCRSLDQGFGEQGKVAIPFEDHGGSAQSIAFQSDGKILVSGTALGGGGSSPITMDLFVARYDTEGDPDPTFDNGSTTQDGVIFRSLTNKWIIGGGLAVQPSDGKIVVTGYSLTSGAVETRPLEFIVTRFHGDTGAIDTTFDTDGVVTIPLGTTNQFEEEEDAVYLFLQGYHDAVLQPDGRIVVGGFSHAVNEDRFAVARVWAQDSSDLDMTALTSNFERVVKGKDLTFTTSHVNQSGDLAQNVRVTSRFSMTVEFVSSNVSGCISAQEGSETVITCPLPNIRVGDPEIKLDLVVKSPASGTLTCSATARSSSFDINLINSTKTKSVTIDDVDVPDDDPDDPPADDPDDDPADDPDGDGSPPPPDEHRQRRSFDIADDPAAGGEGSGGGCSFVPGVAASSQDILFIFLASIPLFLISLKEIFRKKS